MAITSHKGIYSNLKLPYGVKSSSKIFQGKMNRIIQGNEKCICKQDEILIGGKEWQENFDILPKVLDKLYKYNCI